MKPEFVANAWEAAVRGLVERLCPVPDHVAGGHYSRNHWLYDDIGFDSIDIVEAVYGLEALLGADIPDDAAETFVTVGDMIDYCRIAARGHAPVLMLRPPGSI